MNDAAAAEMNWWKDAVFYHIYPRSFMDSNGDGIGDLAGITKKLDYLKWLGVDALWLSPFYKSPMVDFGYDVSDYCSVDPIFGSMEDFDELLREVHERGMKLIIDQIIHTTSSEHPWFLESKSSRDNPKADWYIWKDPAPDGGPPNNWISFFSGKEPDPAWEWVPERGQYYLHVFSRDQCDLNLRNPDVQREMDKMLRFWLDKGVDGFRMDSVCVFFKDPSFRDFQERSTIYAPSSFSVLSKYFVDPILERPENILALETIRNLLDQYSPQRIAIGESASEKGIQSYLEFSSPGRLHMAFNFEFLNAMSLDPQRCLDIVQRTEELFDTRAWPCYVYGHHDGQRFLSRINPEEKLPNEAVAKLMATYLLTLRGTPFIYYGEELGMTNTSIPFEKLVDPFGKAIWPALGRDVCRTPMQWTAGEHAGFTTGEPWLPVHENRDRVNVERQEADEASVLSYYRALIQLRKQIPLLREGAFQADEVREGVLSYRRHSDGQAVRVLLNFSAAPLRFAVGTEGSVLLGTHRQPGQMVQRTVDLQPLEAVIIAEEASVEAAP